MWHQHFGLISAPGSKESEGMSSKTGRKPRRSECLTVFIVFVCFCLIFSNGLLGRLLGRWLHQKGHVVGQSGESESDLDAS